MSYKIMAVRTHSGDSPTTHYDRSQADTPSGGVIPIGIQLQNQISKRVREIDNTYRMAPGPGGLRLAPDEEIPRALVDIHDDRIVLRLMGRLAAIDPDTAFASLWRLLDVFPEANGFELFDPQLNRTINRYTDREAVFAKFQGWMREHAPAQSARRTPWWKRLVASAS